jgi:hypothetical protein
MTTTAFEEIPLDQVRRRKPKGPKYVARKSMQIGGRKIRVGDVVPEAGSWPRVESWIRAGYLDVKE